MVNVPARKNRPESRDETEAVVDESVRMNMPNKIIISI